MLRRSPIRQMDFQRVRVVVWQGGDGEDAVETEGRRAGGFRGREGAGWGVEAADLRCRHCGVEEEVEVVVAD